LGLKPGDEVKYVYDFGDWIEHLLTLGGCPRNNRSNSSGQRCPSEDGR
jgi:hypothetical protein